MLLQLQQVVNALKKPKNYLLLANVFLVFFLIALNNAGVIPLRTGDFIFFTILTLALAMYRPGWAFLFFIGVIPLENINLAPETLGIAARPFQFFGALIIFAVIVRFFFGRLNFKLIKLQWFDWLIVAISAGGFLSVINSIDKIASLKLAVIFVSFAFLYFLSRNYIRNSDDIKKIIPFFLSSSVVIVLYGIWQNIRFIYGGNHFEMMPGRSNATFSEADWLGIYLTLLISAYYALVYYFQTKISDDAEKISNFKFQNKIKYFFYIFLILTFIALILTVARSAWLGAFVASFIFLFVTLTNLKINPRNWQWKEFFKKFILVSSAGAISLAAVFVFHLTNFQLFNRAQSTGSGLQKITIACAENGYIRSVPEKIKNISELEKYGCRHIDLEDIEKEKTVGNMIMEVYRLDPNVNIRAEIYQKSWQEIKKHPILGIGWGNIGQVLGKDARGASLNSSNIFLEVWLGTGIIGIASFVILFLYVLIRAIINYFFAGDNSQKTINLFIIISWFGIVIANLFNAGIFLGFLWIWLAVSNINYENCD